MKIRNYDQQYSEGGQINSQADGNDFGAQIGAAEQDLGNAGYQASEDMQRIAEAKDQVWRSNAVSSYQLQQFQNLQAAKTDPDFAKKYGADGAGFVSSFHDSLDSAGTNLTDTAPSPRSARLLQQQLNDVNTSLIGHAIQFQAETGGAYMKDQVSQMMENDAKLVMQSPGDTAATLDRGKLSIAQTPYLTPEQKTEMLRSYEQNIALSAGKGMVLHSPEKVLAAIAPDVLSSFKPTARVTANTNIPVTNFQPARNVTPATLSYAPLITSAAAQHGVDPNLLTAQINQESHGQANAVNNNDIAVTGKPSIGIAQFQPDTAAQYGVTDPTDPKQAIPGMAAYMSDLLHQFGGDYRKALAAYNWGPGNLKDAIGQYGDQWLAHAPASTQDYISKIFQTSAPTSGAEQSLAFTQQQSATAEPSRAGTNPDWFNKLNWQQQFEIVHEAEQGVRANQVRDSQTLALQKQQREAAQQKEMNGMFDRIGAQQNPLTVAEVRQSGLDYQGKEHMLEAINKVTRGENATDPAVFDQLFQRINLPAGDPNKLSDDRALLPYLGNGVGFEDIQKLRGEMKGRNTPDGAALADLKKNFFSMAKGQIDTSTFISNDPIGKQKYYEFQQNVISTVDKAVRGGADPLELFNPTSKTYLGKLIPQYQRTPTQQMQDYSAFIAGAKTGATPATPGASTPTAAPTTPRQPGESPADYLKRTGSVK